MEQNTGDLKKEIIDELFSEFAVEDELSSLDMNLVQAVSEESQRHGGEIKEAVDVIVEELVQSGEERESAIVRTKRAGRYVLRGHMIIDMHELSKSSSDNIKG